jgi:Ser/Thr protein kinase RdoA (MazF antagonist)
VTHSAWLLSPEEGCFTISCLSVDAARIVAARLLGSRVDDLRRVSSFAGNQVFRVCSGKRVAFLKLADGRDLRREVAVVESLRNRGVPVPVVEAFDPTCELAGRPCALFGDVGGRALRGTEPEFYSAGALLRAVHDVRLDGFGSLADETGGLRGEDRTWTETIQRRVGNLAPIADAGWVPATLLHRAQTVIDERPELIGASTAGRLLHGDFHPRHVFAAGGAITGVIDWGDATSGDPVYDIARVLGVGLLDHDLAHGYALVKVVLGSYGDAAWLQPDLHEKLLAFAVVLLLWSMQGELANGAPWPPFWPPRTEALRLLVEELEHS